MWIEYVRLVTSGKVTCGGGKNTCIFLADVMGTEEFESQEGTKLKTGGNVNCLGKNLVPSKIFSNGKSFFQKSSFMS